MSALAFISAVQFVEHPAIVLFAGLGWQTVVADGLYWVHDPLLSRLLSG